MIVITTPTGSIGHQTLAHVIASGAAPVRVVARDPSRLPGHLRDRVEVVKGSTKDPAVVDEALTGADSVLWVLPPDPSSPSLHAHVMDFTRPLCDAIAARGVPRVVAVSSLGRGAARDAGQIAGVLAMDHLIESTGVHYRSLGMPGFMENLLHQVHPLRAEGVFYGTLPAGRRSPTVATRDIAAAAAGLLTDATWTGQRDVPLPGPEDLSPDDQARVMSEVLGRPIAYRRVPDEAMRADMVSRGVTAAWARGLVAMSAAVDTGIYDAQDYPDRATATPTTFRQWCQDTLLPAVTG
jgi:uncharacterized protein YbjT (DUF2867 family)